MNRPPSASPPFAVKICGITRVDDAVAAIEADVDAIGLNFYGKSKRFIPLDAARQLVTESMARSARRVLWTGVFVNASVDEIAEHVQRVPLDIVQLHGDEPPEMVRLVRERVGSTVRVLRAVRVSQKSLAEVADYLEVARRANSEPDAVLVDAHATEEYGGTGKQLDWTSVHRDLAILGSMPLILAGGLTPENVGVAIATSGVQSVDTASGVEEAPGVKNHEKMRQFLSESRRAFALQG